MGKLIYENPLGWPEDLEGFVLEGDADISFDSGAMRIGCKDRSPEGGKEFVLWCKNSFPSDIAIEWEFRPIKEPGLCELYFAAKGMNGKSIFDEALLPRTGEYEQYHSGDINAFHVSYFRRKEEEDKLFHICKLRKSYGHNLVAKGADPIPDASVNSGWYRMCVIKRLGKIVFGINDLQILEYTDDGNTYGDILTGGCIGFRQQAPMVAEYRNLRVTWI